MQSEKQGALGIEDKLKSRDIKAADLIVFANDVESANPNDLKDTKIRSCRQSRTTS